MSKVLSKRISIFLSIDRKTVNNYFNTHDNSTLYKRQLRFDFEQYLEGLLANYKRHTLLCYKVTCKKEDEDLVKPLMHAVRRHFYMLEKQKRSEFQKFKKRNYRLLFLSMMAVMFFHGVLPIIFPPELSIEPTILNTLDVFSWVILWRPIDKLIFHWNPYLKEISLLHKMANATVIKVNSNDKLFQKTDERIAIQKSMVRA
ncbi:MAG TPA: hypothetical protein VNT20_03550 [Flavisolibacter sp.]|jgi:hypothetical protein|nr:hypothetical protein [Flavisolibacter sp.]